MYLTACKRNLFGSKMTTLGNSIKVISANCQGLQNLSKRRDVLAYLKEKGADIICLQDTHWVEKDNQNINEIWGNKCFLNGKSTNSRGIAILLKNSFEYKVLNYFTDNAGSMMQLVLKLESMTLNLITLYAPNNDDPSFFKDINQLLTNTPADYAIICGDFNLVLNPEKDTKNYKHTNNPKARECVLSIISEHNLTDIYRDRNPDSRRFTWHKRRPLKQARLDFFLVSTTMSDLITKCDIKPGYRSDHSIIEINLLLSKFRIHKGVWKFNNSLLNNQEYVSLINKTIHNEVLRYAAPIYNITFLENCNNYGEITFKIVPDTF